VLVEAFRAGKTLAEVIAATVPPAALSGSRRAATANHRRRASEQLVGQ